MRFGNENTPLLESRLKRVEMWVDFTVVSPIRVLLDILKVSVGRTSGIKDNPVLEIITDLIVITPPNPNLLTKAGRTSHSIVPILTNEGKFTTWSKLRFVRENLPDIVVRVNEDIIDRLFAPLATRSPVIPCGPSKAIAPVADGDKTIEPSITTQLARPVTSA